MNDSLFRDNPILLKHFHSRLRKQHLLPFIIVVVMLCGLFTWMGFSPQNSGYGIQVARYSAFYFIFGLQMLLLFVIGASQVATAVGAAREGGQLDFHRISPQSALSMAIGYLIGAPIRELILFACTIPFYLLFWNLGSPFWNGMGLPILLLAMIPAVFFWYSLALLVALVAPKPRNVGVLIIVLVLAMHLLSSVPLFQHLTLVKTVMGTISVPVERDSLGNIVSPFFSMPVPNVLLALLHQLLIGFFCFYAAVRKLANERAFAFNRTVALAAFVLIVALIFGNILNADIYDDQITGRYSSGYANPESMVVISLYYILALCLMLLTIVTPNKSEVIQGTRHALKLGHSKMSFWEDRAPNHIILAIFTLLAGVFSFSAVLLFQWFTAFHNPGREIELSLLTTSVAIIMGAILLFGAAYQYFPLRFGKQGMNYLALLLFILWVFPPICGIILSMLNNSQTSDYFFALSPLTSIGATLSNSGSSNEQYALIATAVPWISGIVFFFMSRYESRKVMAEEV
ncbi:MAG: hypothetical protein WCJ56_02945 [bacterium]